METLLSQCSNQFENIYNATRRDVMNPTDDIKNEASNRPVEAVHDWATVRRLEIKINMLSPIELDMAHNCSDNEHYDTLTIILRISSTMTTTKIQICKL